MLEILVFNTEKQFPLKKQYTFQNTTDSEGHNWFATSCMKAVKPSLGKNFLGKLCLYLFTSKDGFTISLEKLTNICQKNSHVPSTQLSI